MRKKIIITGAAGRLGRSLTAHLQNRYDLVLLDLIPDPACNIIAADCSRLTADWTATLNGAAAIIHLAANHDPAAPWADLTASNIDTVLNIYLAAAAAGTPRVVLASSVWTLNGYRFKPGPLRETLQPDPGGNPYGATKIFAEATGRAFAAAHGITTIALRLGACWPAENTGGATRDATLASIWTQDCWLSDADMRRGVTAAIEQPCTGFEILNLMSANPRNRWDLAAAARVIGYTPQNQHASRLGPRQWAMALLFRLGRDTLPRAVSRIVSWYW